MVESNRRNLRVLALFLPIVSAAAACADPDDEPPRFSTALTGDAGAIREAGVPDAVDENTAEAGAFPAVVQMKLDDDRDDDAAGLIDPFTYVDRGHWVRVTLPVRAFCGDWGVQGVGLDFPRTVVPTNETLADGSLVRHFTWKPSKATVESIRFVSGPALFDGPMCSYSGVLVVN